LGDLFAAPAKPSTNTNNNSNVNDVLDMFDTLSTTPNTTKQAPLRIVVDFNAGSGLQLGFDYKNVNGAPVMLIEAFNKTGTSISRIDVRFNKNYLGIQPEPTLSLNGDLAANSCKVYEMQLKLAQPPVTQTPLNTKVEMAVRSVRNGQKEAVAKFSDSIPSHIFFENNGIGKDEYANEWKTLPQENQQQEALKSINSDVEGIKRNLSQTNCSFVADRVFEGKGVALYFATKLKDTAILIEISVANTGSGRVVVKSKDKWLSYVVLQAVIGWLN